MSLYGGGMAAGYMIGNLIGGLAIDLLGYPAAFGIVAAMWMVALVQAFATRMPSRAVASPTLASAPRASFWARCVTFVRALGDPAVAPVTAMAFTLNAQHQIGSTFFPVLGIGVGLSGAQIGVVRATQSLVNAVARPLSAPLLQRLGGQRAAIAAYVTGVVLMALVPVVALVGFPGFVVLFICIGTARSIGIVANSVTLADIPESRLSRGMAAAVFNASKDLGNIAGPLIGSALVPVLGFGRMWVAAPLLFLVLYALVMQLPRLRRSARAPA
jgi:predicted MFS family arabinose efflux permease